MICFIKSTFLSEATSLRDALLSQSVKWKRAAAKKVCDAFLFYHFTWKLMFMCLNNTNMWLIHPLCFFKNDILFLFRAISQKIIKKLSWFLEASCLEINFSCCCFFSSLLLLLEDLTFFYNNLSTINLPSSPDRMRVHARLTVSFTQCVLNGVLSSDELTRHSESWCVLTLINKRVFSADDWFTCLSLTDPVLRLLVLSEHQQ